MEDILSIIKGYQDIQVQIDIHANLKEIAEQSKEYYVDQMHATEPHDISAIASDGQPRGNFSPLPLDKAVEEANRCDSIIILEQSNIDRLMAKKKAIDDKMNELKDIEFKVAYLRINKGMQFKEIAQKLGYTEQYMRLVYSKVSKTIQQEFNIQA